ncbi:MAG: hypothetical protein ACRYFK_07385 [Janthinobacterium lividum]
MIALQVAGGWLTLAAGTLTLDISSPYFQVDQVPGTISYPFGLPIAGNQVALNFPHVRADQGEKIAPEPCQLYLEGALRWVGSLVYLSVDEDKQLYAYNFVADAADLAARLDGLNLTQLDLGTCRLDVQLDAADYALPCLRNSAFYDPEKVPYCGIVNYYQGGYLQNVAGKRSPVVPFLRLTQLLPRVMGALGYQVSGEWLTRPEVQQLLIYSDRAAEDDQGRVLLEFARNRHVPDMLVSDFLLALQQFFGLAYDFHPVRRELRIRTLAGVIADQNYVARAAGGPAVTTAVTSDGFTLELELEKDDELNKTLDTGWAKLVVGNGKEAISPKAGTLHVVREGDPNAGRQWLLPAVQVKGASPAFETGDDSHCGLRLLYDRGLQPDSTGSPYPLATWDQVNFAGLVVGASTLHWEGPAGLYALGWQAWLDFLGRATTKERLMPFRVMDLLSLDPARKELVDQKKYLWEALTLSLSTTGRQPLESGQFTYRYCRL